MSSSDPDYEDSPAPASPVSAPPSPRKRRRSSSADSIWSWKRSVVPYNDAYRLLYNDFIQTTTGNPTTHGRPPYKTSQLGVSVWTGNEKEAFFRAVERLGRDNLPGIAAAVGSKSIPETRQLLLLLQDACFEQAGKRGISLQDIPAASDISVVCERQLEAAGDTLATMQERFEAVQEQKRYGENWLVTPALADEIEVAAKGLRASVAAESGDGHDHLEDANTSSLLREIPEARLLIPRSFLDMSRHVFMNPSPNTSYPWPNWQDLATESVTEPCMYRTAFRDFHTLALSMTKRIVQTAIIQATSRIRSQGWRVKKGVKLYVRAKDVHTALDLMGMRKSRRQYWRDVPRRCKLRVTQGKYRKLRSFQWDEIERILDSVEDKTTPLDSDTDTEGVVSEAEQREFKSRAARSGTPLPSVRQPDSDDDADEDEDVDNEVEAPVENTDTDEHAHSDDEVNMEDAQSIVDDDESIYNSTEDELEGLEAFDQHTSRLEERKLRSILGNPLADDQDLEPESEPELIRKIPRRRIGEENDDWRTYTQYRSGWEDLRDPVPAASFLANRKSPSPSHTWDPATDYATDCTTDGRSSGGEGRAKRKQPTRRGKELPLRDPRSYAALQGRQSQSAERHVESEASIDEAEVPTQSIEHGGDLNVGENDAMEWD